MKLKYLNKFLLAFCVSCGVTVTLTSCEDKLDEDPDSRWIKIDSPQKVSQLLTSGYPKSVPAVICELMGDNLVDNNVVVPATHNDAYDEFHEEAYKWEDINSYSTGTDDTPLEVWDKYYFGIAVANHAIDAMKKMSSDPATDPQLSYSWGEAHIMRAYFHFILVNVFAEAYKDETQSMQDWGVPYVTTVEEVVRVDYSKPEYRKKVAEVYQMIDKDIQEGIELIDDSKYKVPAYHFNRNAAYAFAARFYLFKRDYENCLKYANLALGGNPSTSLRKWASMSANTINTLLNDYNDEKAACNYLLLTTYSLQDRMLSACRYAINTGASGTAKDVKNGNDVAVSIPSTKDILYEGGGPNWNGRIPAFDGKIFRWSAGSEYGSWLFRVYEYFEYTNKIAGIGYVHIIYQPFTAEETLLCRAEAKLYLGDRNGAIQDLQAWTASKMIDSELTQTGINRFYKGTAATNIFVNDIHPQQMSASFPILDEEGTNLLNCILHFRRVETMFEGMRWFDIKRYGITVKHVYRGPRDKYAFYDELRWNDPRRVIQIPYNAIDAGYPSTDRALTTNDGNDIRIQNYSVAQ